MTEKEMNRLYAILEKLKNKDDVAALKHAIFLLESCAVITSD
jgi:hypothetical protein